MYTTRCVKCGVVHEHSLVRNSNNKNYVWLKDKVKNKYIVLNKYARDAMNQWPILYLLNLSEHMEDVNSGLAFKLKEYDPVIEVDSEGHYPIFCKECYTNTISSANRTSYCVVDRKISIDTLDLINNRLKENALYTNPSYSPINYDTNRCFSCRSETTIETNSSTNRLAQYLLRIAETKVMLHTPNGRVLNNDYYHLLGCTLNYREPDVATTNTSIELFDCISANTGSSFTRKICSKCIKKHGYAKHKCNDLYRHKSEINFKADSCLNCMPANHKLHNYSYKPNPIFHGNNEDNLYFGFELETYFGKSKHRDILSSILHDRCDPSLRFFYTKPDGSIHEDAVHTLELVTHPFTFEWYKRENPIRNAIKLLRKYCHPIDKGRKGLALNHKRAYLNDTATGPGLHISLSRKAFATWEHLIKFIHFAHRQCVYMEKIGGRAANHYCSWAGNNELAEIATFKVAYAGRPHMTFGQKYRAIACHSSGRVECRFPKSKLSNEHLLANIGLLHALFYFTKNRSEEEIAGATWDKFKEYIKANNIRGKYETILSYMNERGA